MNFFRLLRLQLISLTLDCGPERPRSLGAAQPARPERRTDGVVTVSEDLRQASVVLGEGTNRSLQRPHLL